MSDQRNTKLAKMNLHIPYDDPSAATNDTIYPTGYGPTSQDVLIPALLAAYTDKSPKDINLGIFPLIPMPNWRINYDLARNVEFLKKYVRSANINHSYRAIYSIGGFSTNPFYDYNQQDDFGFSYALDEVTNLFISEYEVSAVSIKEDFSPLISIDVNFMNDFQTKIEYRKSRNMTLSFANNRLTEMQNKEFIVGIGYRFKELKIRLKLPSGEKNFESDLNVRTDVSIRDMNNIIRELDESIKQTDQTQRPLNITQPVGGQRNVSIKVSADYVLSERFNLRLYYDQNRYWEDFL